VKKSFCVFPVSYTVLAIIYYWRPSETRHGNVWTCYCSCWTTWETRN